LISRNEPLLVWNYYPKDIEGDSTLASLPVNIDPHEIEKTLNKMFSP